MTKTIKTLGISTLMTVIIGILILFNFGKIYYFYSIIDFNKNLAQRERIVELIKSGKLKNYTFNSSQNWINLPDSVKQLSEKGTVRIENLDNNLSVFFYQKFRETEDPIGFAYFENGMTKERLMNIQNPNSFFFRDKWVKEIRTNWYYVEYKIERETAP